MRAIEPFRRLRLSRWVEYYRGIPRAELAVLLLFIVALALRVLVSAGLATTVLRVHCATTALVALVVLLATKQRRWLDAPRFLLLACALWLLPSVYGRIGGDGFEYYVQARSVLFDFDFEFSNDYRGLDVPPVRTAAGDVTSRMPFGLALCWIPSLAVTHAAVTLAKWLGADITNDGFSLVYQTAATTSTFFYGVLALVLMEGALRKCYGRAIAILCVLAIWLATPFHFYTVVNPFMSHGASVLAATTFIACWIRARNTDDLSQWVVTGLFGGLMTLIRVQDVFLFLLPAVDIVLSGKPNAVRRLTALGAGPVLGGLVQTSVWISLYGFEFASVVSRHGKFGATPEVMGLLLSPRHGLLSWTPLFIASLVGWVLLARRSKRIALGIWIAFVSAVFVNAAQADWWASESFGQRRMLGLLPLFAWGLSETMAALRRRPVILLAGPLLVLTIWNLQFGHIYNGGLVGPRDQALSLDRVTNAQVELSYRRLLSAQRYLPEFVWVVIYDNLKGVWLDEGGRSLNGLIDLGNEPVNYFPLIGQGWFEPEVEDGIQFRRSRTRRSWLTIPIREPKNYRLLMRARGEIEGYRATARLDVNGNAVGEVELEPGWSEYLFEIPETTLQPGLNRLTFVYSATPRMVDPDFHGKNSVMSVDWLRFTPTRRTR